MLGPPNRVFERFIARVADAARGRAADARPRLLVVRRLPGRLPFAHVQGPAQPRGTTDVRAYVGKTELLALYLS